jgi:HAD superfamily hydrolase (TIGR01509 family)
VESGELELRSGVVRLVDEAIASDVRLAVCSTSNERAVHSILDRLGVSRKSKFDAILAGDVVSRKKPDPEIYLLALEKLQLDARDCFVVEDNRNGLLAAKAAGVKCLITVSSYSQSEDFSQADLVVDELGEPPCVRVTVEQLANMRRDRT